MSKKIIATQLALNLLKSVFYRTMKKHPKSFSDLLGLEYNISFFSNDDEVKNVIEKEGLNNIEKLSQFVVDYCINELNEQNNSFVVLQKQAFIDCIAKINTSIKKVNYAESNEIRKVELFRDAQSILMEVTDKVISLFKEEYYAETLRIDNLDDKALFFSSFSLKSKAITCNDLAKNSIFALVRIYYLQCYIGNQLGENYSAVLQQFGDFYEWTNKNKVFLLMKSYDKKKEDAFWDNTSMLISRFIETPKALNVNAEWENSCDDISDSDDDFYEFSEDDIDFS